MRCAAVAGVVEKRAEFGTSVAAFGAFGTYFGRPSHQHMPAITLWWISLAVVHWTSSHRMSVSDSAPWSLHLSGVRYDDRSTTTSGYAKLSQARGRCSRAVSLFAWYTWSWCCNGVNGWVQELPRAIDYVSWLLLIFPLYLMVRSPLVYSVFRAAHRAVVRRGSDVLMMSTATATAVLIAIFGSCEQIHTTIAPDNTWCACRLIGIGEAAR
jgi:hypothetical protein